MKRLIFPTQSFVAYVEYSEAQAALFVTFRKGGRYMYQNISKGKFEALNRSINKGNYLMNYVIKGKVGEQVGIVAAATIEQITLPSTKYYLENLAL